MPASQVRVKAVSSLHAANEADPSAAPFGFAPFDSAPFDYAQGLRSAATGQAGQARGKGGKETTGFDLDCHGCQRLL